VIVGILIIRSLCIRFCNALDWEGGATRWIWEKGVEAGERGGLDLGRHKKGVGKID
jgi:hypothetical protein